MDDKLQEVLAALERGQKVSQRERKRARDWLRYHGNPIIRQQDRDRKRTKYHSDDTFRARKISKSREYRKEHPGASPTHKKRQAAWDAFRHSLYCELCHSTRYIAFHHKDPKDKLFEINRAGISGRTAEEQWEEIRKCMVVCKRCHCKLHRFGKHFQSKAKEDA